MSRAPRPSAHLVPRRLFMPTPELAAGLAVLSLASVSLVGAVGVLLFFACSAAVIALRPMYSGGQLLRFSPLLLIPILAIMSTIWSEAPQRSMRGGVQLLLTCAMAIVVCRNLRPERLVLALFAAFLAMSLLLLPYVPASLGAGRALQGWYGSKNVAGFNGYVLLALSLAVIFDGKQPVVARLAALGGVPLAVLVAWLAKSGGTTSSVALTLAVFPPLALLAAFRPPVRVALAVLLLCALAGAFLLRDDIAAAIADFRQNVLGKDATLTGRTYLWEVAERLSATRPTWGYGYGAFWRQGNIDAEGLWRWGGVANRSGFNFHNMFVGTRVDLGLVGMWLLILSCVGVAAAGLVRQFVRPSVALACLLGMTAVNYLRSFVEEGLVAPFSLVTLIWLATALYAFPLPEPGEAPAPSGRGARPRPRRLGFDNPRESRVREMRGSY